MKYEIQCKCEGNPLCTLPGSLRRQMTQYHHEPSNWATLCVEHQAEADEYWKERWADYYAGCM